MTGTDNFDEHEKCEVGDWFALGSVFSLVGEQQDGKECSAVRHLLCIDVSSHCIVDHVTLSRKPATLTEKDLLHFLAKILTQIAKPRKGVILLKSLCLSSAELQRDADTAPQGVFLRDLEYHFPAMQKSAFETVRKRLEQFQLKVATDGLCRIEADVTHCFEMQQKTKTPISETIDRINNSTHD
jgi:hypothetical protein